LTGISIAVTALDSVTTFGAGPEGVGAGAGAAAADADSARRKRVILRAAMRRRMESSVREIEDTARLGEPSISFSKLIFVREEWDISSPHWDWLTAQS
jgi:hypothetical protein